MKSHGVLTLFLLTLFTGVLTQAGSGVAAVGLSRLLVAVFGGLALLSLALHEGRQNLA